MRYGTAVLALERTAGSVAGIGEERLAGLLALRVEALEGAPRHQHLAAYLELSGPVAAGRELEGYAAYGAHVGSHVVALHAVAPGHGPHQPSVLVVEADAEAVELQFAAHHEGCSHQSLAHALPEVGHLLAVVCVAEREHGPDVQNGLELVGQVAADALCRAVRVEHLGVTGLEVLQLVHEEVELLVGDNGSILHIVAVVMLVQFVAELHDAGCFVHHRTIVFLPSLR